MEKPLALSRRARGSCILAEEGKFSRFRAKGSPPTTKNLPSPVARHDMHIFRMKQLRLFKVCPLATLGKFVLHPAVIVSEFSYQSHVL
jgi:hypothetical protein